MDSIKDTLFFLFGYERFLFLLTVSNDKSRLPPLPGLPGWHSGEEPACQYRRLGFDSCQGSSVSAGPLVYAAHSSFLWLGWARTGRLGLGSRPCSFAFCSWTLAAPRGLHSGERVSTARCRCVLHRLLVLKHFSSRG